MRVVRWPGEPPPSREPSVVTLGVFDGVHRGHARVLREVVEQSRGRSRRAVVATFERHPAAVLSDEPLPAITSLPHRLRLFEELGLDLCVVIRFDPAVAAMPAARFAREVFNDLLRAELVVLGYDCRFGRGREGDVELCRRLGPELGFEVRSVPPVEEDGRPVSSTAIREAIQRGELERAARLLGRPVSLLGTVVAGEGRGERIGVPTANLDPHNEAIPPDGVYAAWARLDGERIPGVVSIGRRETFHGPEGERAVELHLIGRRMELYGRDVEVEFVARLRPQRAFPGAAELAEQIAEDIRAAAEALGLPGQGAGC